MNKFAALASAAALVLISADVHAESSSWFSRAPGETYEQKKTPPNTTVKSKTAKPQAAPAEPPAKTIPSLVPATGDDAAYTAFDQGQYLTALKLAGEAAKRGEPQSNTLIGRIYSEGLGVDQDDKAAAGWYARASELGDVPGTLALGLLFAQGRGVKKDYQEAGRLFEKAALTGHAEANYNLGLLFLKGQGKPENPIRAFQHIQYAAEKGIPEAQYDLAAFYQAGIGTEPNAAEAAKWLSKAANQGLAVAQYDYAVVLLKGFGLTRDEPKAPALLKSAAEKGIPGAQNRLAYISLEGIGTAKNTVEAAKWRFIAKKNGFADKALDDAIAKLPKPERDKAETLAGEWSDRIQILPSE